MKVFKKSIFFILAVLPILALVIFAVGNIGNTQGIEYMPLGTLTITDTANGVIFTCTPDSWGERLIMPLTGENASNGLLGALGRLCLFLEENAGIPVSVPVFMTILYAMYMFVVEMFDLIMGLLLFVPRKCAEVFR